MEQKIKEFLKMILPNHVKKELTYIKNEFITKYGCISSSQEGEDMILRRIFERKEKGFYVDVGAHHPTRFSNTYFFYKKGWRGINIDATPSSMKKFRKVRPRDINLEIPISDKKEKLIFYIFNEPALNTFDENLAKIRDGKSGCRIVKKVLLETWTLAEVLDKYLPDKLEIDFLSIDVEGMDFKVLKSNNWEKYRPKVVLMEVLKSSLEELINNEIVKFMKKIEYSLFAKTFNTVFFMENNFKKERV